jgi:DNA-binding IclR family transcriptional regulator
VPESIVVGSGAIGVVGRVGPTSWTVLTALAIDAAASGELTVRASVRSLAADLGLNKDTVARAVVRLRRERLVVPVASRFEPSMYRLTIPADVIRFMADASPPHPRRDRHSPTMSGVQLALLEAD